ncbi:anthranilate phosphoribosyltransferase [Kibdelosporangium phytohabitans]|uniref:Anthranilate phosphoribosyltransferase n=1 Tax=Kibdelosporangium phytohabitans TaxID=860235 RepID=A0A0N9HVM5_9PSEU|nr:anthranilate phosphoribosyltransferase [Kibdelosporangium phytohabitans]ALG09176.1 anthranilate phosphoribosyltransferase [Kibdelosporangium phytohabitans]MBE1469599.1 anthranilate phosphoribosyltransferase [Kibdelosporangium phytohabitans]
MIDLIKRVSRGETLSEAEAAHAMRSIMCGAAGPARIAGLAMAMAMRGETVDEIVGMARTAREMARPVPFGSNVLDTCGTGGDGLNTFNISTASAIVAAACGVQVAKHGNRSASSGCGSADVLEELGVRIELTPEEAGRCLAETGIVFLFAPSFHPAFRHAAGPRKELGIRTVFNLLGPLCNPARARYQALGVPDADVVAPMAEVLSRLGVTRALVFHSEDGLDELSLGAPSTVVEVVDGVRRSYRFDPADLGLARASVAQLAGGDRAENAAIIRRIFAGETGPKRDIVLLNAAAALRITGHAVDWGDGLAQAARVIDSGAVTALLDRWIAVSQDRVAVPS